MPRTRLWLLALPSLLLGACADWTVPTDSTDAGAVATGSTPASAAIPAGSGRPLVRAFSFLPPLDREPLPEGKLDPTLLPELKVEVCEWSGSACGAVVARFDVHGRGSDRLRLEADEGLHYHVNWHPGRASRGLHRIRVLLGEAEVGHVDVELRSRGAVPIKFFVGRERLPGDPSTPHALPRVPFQVRSEDYSDDASAAARDLSLLPHPAAGARP